ncbi:hypothetical protein SORBI_3008G110151 [Sorghum bicolor]|uniref:Uncharacterized protein n=1 Tax=Sorghum bicolor TaxID=4558 RepID=A0A1Z5R623_SORBI|nr:hypothetical protein SORBI_3008G110151 [Sorghum bicolor]
MHLLHRSSMFSADGGRVLRRVGSSPRAPPPPPPPRHTTLSRSESIKKKSGAAKRRSKRARLRAGLAAALQELRLASGRKRPVGHRY